MQNDMRDRLVKLLRADMRTECDKHSDCLECPYYNDEDACLSHLATMCADHLIANGVVLPPCRVEQMVWLIKPLNWQQTEWGIKEGKISMIQQKADKSWKFRVTENHSVQDYTVDKIGKTAFFTKEEAEQKLKELSE